jgi:hypothetical protein
MTKRSLNIYELIFGAFFILKITGEGIENWNWFFVFLPLIIGFIHNFFSLVYRKTELNNDLNSKLQDLYLDAKKKQFARRAIRDAKRDIESVRRNLSEK